MEYWGKLPYKVIYIDGSKKAFEFHSKKVENIDYIHMPGGSYSERVLHALELLKTEYVSMIPDDEYYLFLLISKNICLFNTSVS